jgi:hypothetical protein
MQQYATTYLLAMWCRANSLETKNNEAFLEMIMNFILCIGTPVKATFKLKHALLTQVKYVTKSQNESFA